MRTPIVFVHGNGDSAAGWSRLKEKFRQAGYDSSEMWACSFDPPANESHDHYVKQLASFVADVLQKTAAPAINFVGHSLGCTVIRYYIKCFGGYQHTRGVVLIAGANHGLPAADLTLNFADQFKQSPEINTLGTKFLNLLNAGNPDGKEIFGASRVMTISGPDDDFYAFFEESPQLNGADNRVLPGYGHFGLRDVDESFRCMCRFFEEDGTGGEDVIGRNPLPPRPSVPTGRWIILAGPQKGHQIDFLPDGHFSATFDKGSFEGTYRIQPLGSMGIVKLDFKIGPVKDQLNGVFKVNMNGNLLRLSLNPASTPPLDQVSAGSIIAFAPTFEKVMDPTPLRAELCGVWRSRPQDLGFCHAGGWRDLRLELSSTGEFVLKGANTISPAGFCELRGSFSTSDAGKARSGITFTCESVSGEVPFFIAGDVLPGLFCYRSGPAETLSIQWGSAMFGIHRPSCLDLPVVLSR